MDLVVTASAADPVLDGDDVDVTGASISMVVCFCYCIGSLAVLIAFCIFVMGIVQYGKNSVSYENWEVSRGLWLDFLSNLLQVNTRDDVMRWRQRARKWMPCHGEEV